ncbi:hypothetical protein SLA2020_455270 [Shorea laevis]
MVFSPSRWVLQESDASIFSFLRLLLPRSSATVPNASEGEEMCPVVRGVILDHSLVLDPGKVGSFTTAAKSLLRRLHYSKIRTGVSYGSGLSTDKVNLLKSVAEPYSCDCLLLSGCSTDAAVGEITCAWGDIRGSILYLAPNLDALHKISCRCLTIKDVEVTNAYPKSSRLDINKLEELPLTICRLNKKVIESDVVTVGYIMKPSREEDFAKRGALPMCPTPNGLMFLPLTFDLPLSLQLEDVDVVLHKATDEIVSIDLSCQAESSYKITYTPGMQELQRHIECHSDCFVVDPLKNIYPVLDRLTIQQILLGLEGLKIEGRNAIRGPHFLKVSYFDEPDLAKRLLEAKLSLPSIVKPQVACGVPDAHSMAIVFRDEDFNDLNVPTPAVIQEYVDHSSTVFKFYVLGENVFHAVKKSTPNADVLLKLSERNGLKPILFDSLKSLPTDSGKQNPGDQEHNIDLGLVRDAANWLSKTLNLTIFGFDVVIQEGSGDHVIVDVNYLPSFKEVPDDVAIPAFWEAIRKKFDSKAVEKQ